MSDININSSTASKPTTSDIHRTVEPPKNSSKPPVPATNDSYTLGDPITKKGGMIFCNVEDTNSETSNQINAMRKAKNVLGKFLSSKFGKNNESWLVTSLRKLLASPTTPFKKSIIVFKNNIAAAKKNSDSLAMFDFDYGQLLSSSNNTILSPGSEFCHPSILSII